jgi:hypothetical protein
MQEQQYIIIYDSTNNEQKVSRWASIASQRKPESGQIFLKMIGKSYQ